MIIVTRIVERCQLKTHIRENVQSLDDFTNCQNTLSFYNARQRASVCGTRSVARIAYTLC
jgi:hypothetical protein